MQKKITIYDVAVRAGVSSSTVSRVLNDSPRVAERTRSCVRSAMRELGYVPDRTARTLALGRSGHRQEGQEDEEGYFPSVQANGEKELLRFEGNWEASERDAIRQAISRSRAESVLWLCVKTHVQDANTWIALKLHGACEVVIAGSVHDLATRILRHEDMYLRPDTSPLG